MTQRELFLQHVAQTSPAPLALEIERAAGMFLYDTQQRPILDLISGIAVANIGHSHPEVLEAIRIQSSKYLHLMVYGELVQTPQVQFAKALTDWLPENLQSVYFTNSGAEAIEGAMKLAKRITGRTNFVHFRHSYHGSTQGALSIIGDEYFKTSFRPLLPDVTMLEYGVHEELEKITAHTAAVILDPVQAESGVTVPSADYLKKVRAVCSRHGALMILDEAQTAFGRCGTMFNFGEDSAPDILVLAKSLGGGLPLGAFISSIENMRTLTDQPVLGHITTFGGHPLSCAAGLAALKVLQEKDLMQSVEEKGALFSTLLRHPLITGVNRKGLMLAVKFDSFERNKRIIDRCIEKGVFTDWFLFASNCMRICPPLIITEAQIRSACEIILAACNEEMD
ncbi:MAG: aminotransferase class III-fold pyridoxal phosphate-dependent enzyme [Chitinophagales bacterium]